jgi:hypothetical protein
MDVLNSNIASNVTHRWKLELLLMMFMLPLLQLRHVYCPFLYRYLLLIHAKWKLSSLKTSSNNMPCLTLVLPLLLLRSHILCMHVIKPLKHPFHMPFDVPTFEIDTSNCPPFNVVLMLLKVVFFYSTCHQSG